jgi:hypothetical protein
MSLPDIYLGAFRHQVPASEWIMDKTLSIHSLARRAVWRFRVSRCLRLLPIVAMASTGRFLGLSIRTSLLAAHAVKSLWNEPKRPPTPGKAENAVIWLLIIGVIVDTLSTFLTYGNWMANSMSVKPAYYRGSLGHFLCTQFAFLL